MTTQEVYIAARDLPFPERIRLAALILEDLSLTTLPLLVSQSVPEFSTVWSEGDIRDFSAHSAHYMETVYPAEENLLPGPKEVSKLRAEQNRD